MIFFFLPDDSNIAFQIFIRKGILDILTYDLNGIITVQDHNAAGRGTLHILMQQWENIKG